MSRKRETRKEVTRRMNQNEFQKTVEEQMKRCMDMLLKKGVEYDYETSDRLRSFKRGAVILNMTPKQVLTGYLNKHIISIYDMCNSSREYPVEQWNEKITDAINYLLLLRAMIEEETK